MKGDSLDLASRVILLEVPVQRDECCHTGGSIAFDRQGNLYVSTGDNTNPFATGYAPIDERPGRSPWDAQKSSANTNDLRGKILRIRPEPNGTYTIPSGNLFPPGTPQTRPEIYLMGLRNPFRIAVNRTNDDLYVADYSPDAQQPNPLRGPAGHGRWMLIRKPGNYGWPFCVTLDMPYIDYDFATGESGEPFDCRRRRLHVCCRGRVRDDLLRRAAKRNVATGVVTVMVGVEDRRKFDIFGFDFLEHRLGLGRIDDRRLVGLLTDEQIAVVIAQEWNLDDSHVVDL